jgi:threonine dehydratase
MGVTEYLKRHPAPVKLFGCEAYNYPTYAHFDHARSPTIADGLCLEVPHPKVQQRIREMDVAIHLVKEAAIRAAMAQLFALQGLMVEPSSAVTVAYVSEHIDKLEEPVCLILTGANITREDFFRLWPVNGSPVQQSTWNS